MPRVGITQGDINGVGYEVILKTLAVPEFMGICTPVIYGAVKALAYHRKVFDLQVPVNMIGRAEDAAEGKVNMVSVCDEEVPISLGQTSAEAGATALAALQRAVADLRAGRIDVLVTAPINKASIQSEEFKFCGHTEYIEAQLRKPVVAEAEEGDAGSETALDERGIETAGGVGDSGVADGNAGSEVVGAVTGDMTDGAGREAVGGIVGAAVGGTVGAAVGGIVGAAGGEAVGGSAVRGKGKAAAFEGEEDEKKADTCPQGEALMILMNDALRVALVTTHLPLREVAGAITGDGIVRKLRIFDRSLKRDFSITRPRIAVLSLNPHAGDGGLLGDEEERVISPAIAEANKAGVHAYGPFAADGFFGTRAYEKFDGVLAMYHDQGLSAFKALAMENGVNFTAGLPVVRTSPDHGVGYDIAGKGVADEGSFREAIYAAIDISRNRAAWDEGHASPLRKLYHERKEDERPFGRLPQMRL